MTQGPIPDRQPLARTRGTDIEPMTAGADPVPARATPGLPTVLVVDGIAANVETLHRILGDSYRLVEARSAEDALDLAVVEAPDLILLDVGVLAGDGQRLCDRLMLETGRTSPPGILVTAPDEDSGELHRVELGALDSLIRPFRPSLVRARVRTHVELKRSRDALERVVSIDELTGVASRRRFDEAIQQEWRRGQRALVPLSLIMVDIDAFKPFNDNYGHLAGDQCLRSVARALALTARRFTDLVARFAGDEFAALCPITEARGAAVVAERVRQAVDALGIPHAHSAIADHVTVSVGASTSVPSASSTPAALIDAADRRLYDAKRAGRNQTRSEA